MSRPAHIAPLDEALEAHLAALDQAERHQVDVLERYADWLKEHEEQRQAIEDAQKARADHYYAAKACEDAIRKLGFVVLKPGGPGGISPKGTSRLDSHPGNFREPVTPSEGAGDE